MDKKYKVYLYKSPSGKVYIGQTCKTLSRRACGNGIGYRHSTHFYAAIQKYGIENFETTILKDNLTLEEANYWEEYYIKQYDSTNRKKGYNITPGGNNHTISEEGRERIRQRMIKNNPMKNPETVKKMQETLKKLNIVHHNNTGYNLSEEARKHISDGHKKKVICIETGIIYESRNAAAEAMGVSGSGIGRAIKGEQETSAGYHWRYLDEN